MHAPWCGKVSGPAEQAKLCLQALGLVRVLFHTMVHGWRKWDTPPAIKLLMLVHHPNFTITSQSCFELFLEAHTKAFDRMWRSRFNAPNSRATIAVIDAQGINDANIMSTMLR